MYPLIPFVQWISVVSTSDFPHALQSVYCELGLNKDNSCPIDGGWTSWNAWGPCIGKCGYKGKRKRSRSCNNPLPLNNGAPCIGPSYQTETCHILRCTVSDYEKIIHSDLVRKKEMQIVKEDHKKLPALIELCFSLDCTFPMVKKILGNDAMIYWNAMNCVKYNAGCPTPGGWSHWKVWSPCTASCGRGQRYRTRTCNSPLPSNPELTCNGEAFEIEKCTGFDCKKHSMGTWSNWSEWSPCSTKCGSGMQSRKRSCVETQNKQKTLCRGSAEEIKACKVSNCLIDGAWSPWTDWSVCSSDCGIGTQFRNRMCNNPSPSGNGTHCSGIASEVQQCFTKPCNVRSHQVAHFTGHDSLFYAANNKPSRLLHVYLRFLPLVPFGMLLDRFPNNCQGLKCDFVRISLQNGKIVLLSDISGCRLGLIHENKLEIGQWHVILVSICGAYAMIRVDNGSHKTVPFSCIPVSPDLDHSMKVGEGFRGQIQEIAINFATVQLRTPQEGRGASYTDNNVQYVMGDDEEGFIHVALTESVAAPCPKELDFWRVTIALRPRNINGVIAVIPGDCLDRYILLMSEDGRLKLKFHHGVVFATVETMEHILIGQWFEIIIVQNGHNLYMQVNGNEKNYVPPTSKKLAIICTENIFLGAVRDEIKEEVCPKCVELPQMSFTLGYLDIDGNQLDLLSLPVLETTSKRVASRTISFSDQYIEVPLLLGQELKLSCLYDNVSREEQVDSVSFKETYVTWLMLDKQLDVYKNWYFKDDGHVSAISAASYTTRNEIENFYSCHMHRYKNKYLKTSNQALVTFGVSIIDERREYHDISLKEWSCICGTTITCWMVLMIWILLEGLWDVKNGPGFYRLTRVVTNDNSASTVKFVLSKSGITLLGSQQAAVDIVAKITEIELRPEAE